MLSLANSGPATTQIPVLANTAADTPTLGGIVVDQGDSGVRRQGKVGTGTGDDAVGGTTASTLVGQNGCLGGGIEERNDLHSERR